MIAYEYMCYLDRKQIPFFDLTWREKVCLWVLMCVYGRRYWQETLVEQGRSFRYHLRREERKRMRLLNMYLLHVHDAPDAVFNKLDAPTPFEAAVNSFVAMSDEEFSRLRTSTPTKGDTP